MSTRAVIQITTHDGKTNHYYQHNDGYPKNMIPVIKKVLTGHVPPETWEPLSTIHDYPIDMEYIYIAGYLSPDRPIIRCFKATTWNSFK